MGNEVIVFGPLLLLCAAAEGIGGVRLLGGWISPPFLLSLSAYCALTRRSWIMAAEIVVVGIVQDSISFTPLGFSIAIFGLMGVVLERIRPVLYASHLITQAVLGGVLGAVFGFSGAVAYMARGVMPSLTTLIRVITGMSIAAAVTTPVTFWVGGHLDRMVGSHAGAH
ncbi:MAG TPA: hypothetical protein EYP62_09230 [Kiritimatiellae bacterium]|nr:hypothetical protein [Kiritimatiellia bacterium]